MKKWDDTRPHYLGMYIETPMIDLRRLAGEDDEAFQRRIAAEIGGQDTFARLDTYLMFGECLDHFAGSVAHAKRIGWQGAAGRAREEHEDGCRCPPKVRLDLKRQMETISNQQRIIEEATSRLAASKREAERLGEILMVEVLKKVKALLQVPPHPPVLIGVVADDVEKVLQHLPSSDQVTVIHLSGTDPFSLAEEVARHQKECFERAASLVVVIGWEAKREMNKMHRGLSSAMTWYTL